MVTRAAALSPEQVRGWLAEVVDPEIPVLTIDDLGVLRAVEVAGDAAVVTITPTYSGCPAMDAIRDDITRVLGEHGMRQVEVRTVLAPAWTTDWIGPGARAKLAAAGIAPPAVPSRGLSPTPGPVPVALGVRCPRCGSTRTRVLSRFGSTACKQLHACADCGEPFDHLRTLA